MGAAFNYGKSSDLGINSPTHRNSHNEDLFGDEPVTVKTTAVRSSNDIIEDIFSSAATSSAPIDDFDPRADEATTADFGDFASAFGANQFTPVAAAPATNEFADFSSFASTPAPAAFAPVFAEPPQSTNNLLSSADLFGNNVIASAFTSPTAASNSKDLLSDFGDLTLNPIQGESLAERFPFFLFDFQLPRRLSIVHAIPGDFYETKG
jgi:clathrin interactor 1